MRLLVPGDPMGWTQTSSAGLALEIAAHPKSPILERFFEGYDRAFILAEEKETLEGFRACLALFEPPQHDRLLARYGPYLETVVIAREAPGGPVVGGANLIVYPNDPRGLASNLNYIFIVPEARGRGLFRRLTESVREAAASWWTPAGDALLTTIELNDPFALSPDDYARDTKAAGVDQVDRLRMWLGQGAQILDVDYVQPPLNDDSAPAAELVLAVLGAQEPILPARALRGHLERFFGISVLKGRDPYDLAVSARQLDLLSAMEARGQGVPLFPADHVQTALSQLKLPSERGFRRLRDFLHQRP